MASKKRKIDKQPNRDELRDQLSHDISDFLAQGGQVLSIPSGVSGEPSAIGRKQEEIRPSTKVVIQTPVTYGSL